jgi:hypothetical protein
LELPPLKKGGFYLIALFKGNPDLSGKGFVVELIYGNLDGNNDFCVGVVLREFCKHVGISNSSGI